MTKTIAEIDAELEVLRREFKNIEMQIAESYKSARCAGADEAQMIAVADVYLKRTARMIEISREMDCLYRFRDTLEVAARAKTLDQLAAKEQTPKRGRSSTKKILVGLAIVAGIVGTTAGAYSIFKK